MNSNVSQPESSRPVSIKEIFLAAREVSAGEPRDRYLTEAVGDDQELRRRIERMLASESSSAPKPLAQAVDLLDLADDVTTDSGIDVTEHPSIGPYKIREQIGEGGMGTVFVAEQKSPVRRKVALKIIRAGMASKEVVARFEAERQALAMMDHPNIARVLDGGATEDELPFFVMELVLGLRINEYCDAKRLTLEERLKLFVDVCRAVQHAHQKGIIHRDLKPSNILVTEIDGKAVPKVIDFGVAKALHQKLTDQTVYTEFAQVLGTPLYMSPEQAGMGVVDVDTRSDVYSLGVVLYELLTGKTPVDREQLKKITLDEMRRVIREDEPKRPSAMVNTLVAEGQSTVAEQCGVDPRKLSQSLAGELDWLVMKTLEKDRERRYESANALAADIQRYLNDEPIEACPPTMRYRFGKFVSRRRGLVTALAPAVLAIPIAAALLWSERSQTIAALSHATTQEQSAQRQKNLADERAEEAVAQRKIAQLNLYYAEIVSGHIDQQQGEMTRLEQKLNRHLPVSDQDDHRGWEWYYLFSSCHPETRTLVGHGIKLNPTWSPDGELIASSGMIYRAQTGESVARLVPSWILKKEGAWSPDGLTYAWGMASDDSGIYLWDRESDELSALRGHAESVWSIAWSPDGKHLASGGIDKEVWVWDVAARAPIHKFKAGGIVTDVVWSPDGELLAAGGQRNGVMFWNPKTGELIKHVKELGGRGTGSRVRLAWHPDSEQLAVCTPESWFLLRRSDWDVIPQDNQGKDGGYSVAWRPDGKEIAVANNGFVSILDPTDQTATLTLYGPAGSLNAVAWSPNANQLSTFDDRGDIKIWDLNSRSQTSVLNTGSPIQSLSWLPDSKTIVAVDSVEHATSTWSATDGRQLGVETAITDGQLRWSPDRHLVACLPGVGQNEIRILDGKTGAVHSIWQPTANGRVRGISWSMDGAKLAIRQRQGSSTNVELWDVHNEQRISSWTLEGPGNASLIDMLWSPDGVHIVIPAMGQESQDGTTKYWGHVYVVDVARGVTLLKHRIASSRHSFVTSLAWNSSGQTIAVGSNKGTLETVAIDSGKRRFSNQISRSSIRSLAWSPDGRRIVSADHDGTVKVLAAGSGADLLRFELDDVGEHVTWSPDGKRLAAATRSGKIHVWDATKAYEYSPEGSKRGELAWTYYRLPRRSNAAEENARLRTVLNLAPDTLGYWELRGNVNAKLGEFDHASQEFAKAIEPGLGRSFSAARYYGYSLLGAGKTDAYRRHCDAFLEAYADRELPSSAARVAWLCTLTENRQLDVAMAVRLAIEHAHREEEYQGEILGAALYRNQQYQESANLLADVVDQLQVHRQPSQAGRLASSLYFLAMARQQLGHSYQAGRILADANNIPTASSWTDRVQMQVLKQEATALIER